MALATAGLKKIGWRNAKSHYVNNAKHSVEQAGYDWSMWSSLVTAYADDVRSQWGQIFTEDPTNREKSSVAEGKLKALIKQIQEPVVAELNRMPRTIEKAANSAAFAIELSSSSADPLCFPEFLSLTSVTDLSHVSAFKSTIRKCLLTNDFPDPPRYWENEWSAAWMRYAERFEARNARKFLADTTFYFESELRLQLGSLWEKTSDVDFPANLRLALQTAWTISSSLRARAKVASAMAEALRTVLTWQSSDGSWPTVNGNRELANCPATTAFATFCLITYGDRSKCRASVNQAVDWLLSNANPSGGWGAGLAKGATENLDIVVTVTVLDVCRLWGVSLDHPVLLAAEAVLLEAQDFTGVWSDASGNAEEYLTCLVLGYFERREQRTAEMGEAATLGRGLLLKAHALSLSDAPTDSMLALVSLYHGLEYTLYGFLLKHDVEIRTNRGETLGVREALVAFDTLAKKKQWIADSARLPHRTQLTELAAKRDEVIHRMGRVEPQQVEDFLEQVFSFVSKFSYKTLGYSLID
jgi:hypothetical protein